MRLHKRSWIAILALLLAVGEAFANEAPKSEGEGDKAVIPALPKDEKEFYEKTSRLNLLSSRIAEAEKKFQAMVHEKAEEKTSEGKQRLIKEMVAITQERNKSADEYMKLKSEISLRYPNKGEHLNRRYQIQGKKSLEEMEGAAGLDELLTRTKKVVEKKFATFDDPDEKRQPEATEVIKAEHEKPKKLRLEK